ncbi:MAG: type II toxin-antitoxin system HigB family toxin [Xenococcaceae cyanobacterium MO_167.B52]|nr:type II toxin-antitoxin system HigB family toxin [Xenococcaceae cyanobacterium MO_167.B52]
MRLIAISKLREAAACYPDVSNQIEDFYETIKKAQWKNLIDIQKTFSTAEAVGNFTVINIKGNSYRLILNINYKKQLIFFKYFLTHADYDKDKWKNDNHYQS